MILYFVGRTKQEAHARVPFTSYNEAWEAIHDPGRFPIEGAKPHPRTKRAPAPLAKIYVMNTEQTEIFDMEDEDDNAAFYGFDCNRITHGPAVRRLQESPPDARQRRHLRAVHVSDVPE